jgi:5-methylthioadenosine/S-adenosylhomocysteine deaminase
MNSIIEGGTLVTMSPQGTIKNGAIVIEDNTIVEIGKATMLKPKYRRYERINAKDKVVIPGLINTHHHAAMSILRGYADDLSLKTWLEKWIWPMEKHMTSRDIYIGALLTAIESIMGGTTTINTMYHYKEQYNEAQAFAETGLRGTVGHVCFSWRKKQDKKSLKSLASTWHNQEEGRIRVSVDPHAPYTVDPKYMKELRVFTRELNDKHASAESPIIWHMHIAETVDEPEKIQQAFKAPVRGGVLEYLNSLGVLDKDVIASHCVHLTARDVDILKQRNVKVAHNPISNLKLASGISPVSKLLDRGITVSLGTDSSCSNNSSDMFEVMKVAALLQKGITRNPTALSAEQALRMATINGAEALAWDKEIGSLTTGKKADLAIIDFRKPHLTPIYNEASHLVYSAKSPDVDTVFIDGKIVMENRQLRTVDASKVMELAKKTKSHLLERLK